MATIPVGELAKYRRGAEKLIAIDYDKPQFNNMIQAAVDQILNPTERTTVEGEINDANGDYTPNKAVLDYVFKQGLLESARQI